MSDANPSPAVRRHTIRISTLTLSVALLAAAGCGTRSQGVFRDDSSRAGCQVHQTGQPGTAYTGGTNGNTEAILAMMSYLTARGDEPYCDGLPPNGSDRTWAALYARLGGAAAHVAAITGAAAPGHGASGDLGAIGPR